MVNGHALAAVDLALGVGRWAFSPEVAAKEPTEHDSKIDRGRYLVTGLGHCGSYHSPRGIGMQEKALSDSDANDFLAGGAPLEGWVAKSLRGDKNDGLGAWNEEEIAQLLKTGRTARTAVFGSMTDLIQHSMQHLTDDDRLAIAHYLKSRPPAKPDEAPVADSSDTTKQLSNMDAQAVGAPTYADNCMACHRSDSRGYEKVFPALVGNSVVNIEDATSLIHIVLAAGDLPGNRHAPTGFAMLGFAWRLTDQEVVDVVLFIRKGWNNAGKPVTAKEVAEQRRAMLERTAQAQH